LGSGAVDEPLSSRVRQNSRIVNIFDLKPADFKQNPFGLYPP
jgi:hypothetical protein